MATQLETDTLAIKNKLKVINGYASAIVNHTDYDVNIKLQYVQTNDKQYIKTGIITASNVDIEMDFETTGIAGGYGRVWGTSGDMQYELADTESTTNYRISVNGSGKTFSASGRKRVKMTGTGRVYLNGTELFNLNNSHSGQEIWLFWGNSGDWKDTHSQVKMYSTKIWQNGTLVRDFIPVKRKLDDVVCLYDNVTKQYFLNSGSSNFIAGGEL